MVPLRDVPTHELIKELLARWISKDKEAIASISIITIRALRELRNKVIAEIDSRYPHILD